MAKNRFPNRRFKRRFRKKRFFRKSKKSNFNKPSIMIQKAPGSFITDRYMCKLKYQEQFQYGNSVTQTRLFCGNGIWDPSLSSDGTNCAGFTELSALYQKYHVRASKIKCQFVSGANNETYYVSVVPSADIGMAVAGMKQLLQQPYIKYALLSVAGGSLDNVNLNTYMSTQKIFGFPHNRNEDNFSGLTTFAGGTNPNNRWFWIVSASPVANTIALDVLVDVIITYYVEFYDRRITPLGRSFLGVTGPGDIGGSTGPAMVGATGS